MSSIIARSTLPELFQDLAGELTRFVQFDRLALLLNDEARNVIVLDELFSTFPHHAWPRAEWPFDQSPAGEAIWTQQPLHIRAVETETRYLQLLTISGRRFLYLTELVPGESEQPLVFRFVSEARSRRCQHSHRALRRSMIQKQWPDRK